MFCHVEYNNTIPGLENTITEPDLKNGFQNSSCWQGGGVDLLFSSMLNIRGLSPMSANFQ